MKTDLMSTIKEDCGLWEKLNNENKMLCDYLYIQECDNSKETGMYQLILNGLELWYGTLSEINAIVKSMLYRLTRDYEAGGD